MGQGQGTQLTRDTITGEQFRAYFDFRQRCVNNIFQKCIIPQEVNKEADFELSQTELQCVEEYAALHAAFIKGGFQQITQLYEQHQRDMYERARMEQMQAQGRR
ncbi:Hypothetical protein, putative [Bodo saltans]|uniref:Uncharacterized protein n=1 Tax=Bodo saltans TaxID=75058 RepID=A0A0S4J0J3_BODSA|nr:Hypothetical protein, putative [Bodo saltans]|eukprot:CUG06426.1 Hypothetical protein, putative [Bodo saltans]